jgi:hypothetical protein
MRGEVNDLSASNNSGEADILVSPAPANSPARITGVSPVQEAMEITGTEVSQTTKRSAWAGRP